jgi:ABC-type multidrug transport system ATPase subunit
MLFFFRRCTGYVEQFDTQSPQLTIRETVEFSAMMRLDESIPVETKKKFVDQVLAMLELDEEADLLVGSDNTGGLSFEQKKRLSIAVELAANPSIIFLDEPTSGNNIFQDHMLVSRHYQPLLFDLFLLLQDWMQEPQAL